MQPLMLVLRCCRPAAGSRQPFHAQVVFAACSQSVQRATRCLHSWWEQPASARRSCAYRCACPLHCQPDCRSFELASCLRAEQRGLPAAADRLLQSSCCCRYALPAAASADALPRAAGQHESHFCSLAANQASSCSPPADVCAGLLGVTLPQCGWLPVTVDVNMQSLTAGFLARRCVCWAAWSGRLRARPSCIWTPKRSSVGAGADAWWAACAACCAMQACGCDHLLPRCSLCVTAFHLRLACRPAVLTAVSMIQVIRDDRFPADPSTQQAAEVQVQRSLPYPPLPNRMTQIARERFALKQFNSAFPAAIHCWQDDPDCARALPRGLPWGGGACGAGLEGAGVQPAQQPGAAERAGPGGGAERAGHAGKVGALGLLGVLRYLHAGDRRAALSVAHRFAAGLVASPLAHPTNLPSLFSQSGVQSLEQAVIDHKVRLIVLDSAACLARADFAPGSLPDRQRMLGQQVGAACWPACLHACMLYGDDRVCLSAA